MVLCLGSSAAQTPTRESLRPVDAADVLEIVGEHRGRVVLLNFWATWCPPCIVEFPEIVSLENEYRERGLTVVSVSADFPTKLETDLLPFLEEHQPDFPVHLMQTDDVDEFIRVIDPEWSGAIPATFFYASDGNLAHKQFKVMTREEMVGVVEGLLETAGRRED